MIGLNDKLANVRRVRKVTVEINCFVQALVNQYPDPQRAFRDMPTPDADGNVANFFRHEMFGPIMQLAHRATQEQYAQDLNLVEAADRAHHVVRMKRYGRLFTYAFNTVKQHYLYDGMQHISFTVTTKEDPDAVAQDMVEFIQSTCSYLMGEIETSKNDYDVWLKQAYRELIGALLDIVFTGPTQFNYMSVTSKDA